MKLATRTGIVALALAVLVLLLGPGLRSGQGSTTGTYRLHASFTTAPRGAQVTYIVSGARPVTVRLYDPSKQVNAGDWELDVIYRRGTGGIILTIELDNRDREGQSACSITKVRLGIETQVVARGWGTDDAMASCSFDTMQ